MPIIDIKGYQKHIIDSNVTATFLKRWIFPIVGVVSRGSARSQQNRLVYKAATFLHIRTPNRPMQKWYYLRTTLYRQNIYVYVHYTTKKSQSDCLRVIRQVLAGGWRGRAGSALGWVSSGLGFRCHTPHSSVLSDFWIKPVKS